MNLIRLQQTHRYKTSRDYKKLYAMMQEEAVICILNDGSRTTVADTIYHRNVAQISVPGLCYIYAISEADFISQCKLIEVEFIEPEEGILL